MFKLSLFRTVRTVASAAVALVLALGAATSVFAQGETPPAAPPEPGVRWGGGVVTAVGDGSFTVHTRRGRDVTVFVEAATAFFDGQGQPASFADIAVGDRVGGVVEVRADGQTYARRVIVFPPNTRYVGVGVVTGLEADAFDFVSRRGQVWEFYVDDATVFSNRAGDGLTFDDLHLEARAGVHAELREDGKWWATG
jgi:hypothetical protein